MRYGLDLFVRMSAGRTVHPGTELGNDDSERGRVVTSCGVYITCSPGLTTSRWSFRGVVATKSWRTFLLVSAEQCPHTESGAIGAWSLLIILSLPLTFTDLSTVPQSLFHMRA